MTKLRIPLTLLAATTLALTGCSADKQSNTAAPEATKDEPANTKPVVAKDVLLTQAEGGADWEYINIADLNGEREQAMPGSLERMKQMSKSNTAEPAACYELAARGIDSIVRQADNLDTLAVAQFGMPNEGTITVNVATDPNLPQLPKDPGGDCGTFVLNLNNKPSSYAVEKTQATVKNVKDFRGGATTLKETSNPLVGEVGGQTHTFGAMVDGAYVQVHGTKEVSEQEVVDIFNKQAEKIRKR